MKAAHVYRYNTYREMPWRNGKGSTLEIAREPVVDGDFSWRLSLASISGSCDFSPYTNYRRAMVLVSGASLRLSFQGHRGCSLHALRRCARFDGGWRTRCVAADGPCTDLSLIVRSTDVLQQPTVLQVTTDRQLMNAAGCHMALFVINGSVEIVTGADPSQSLREHDTLIVQPPTTRAVKIHNVTHATAQLAILRWRTNPDDPVSEELPSS